MNTLNQTPQVPQDAESCTQEAAPIRGLGEVAAGLRALQQACGCQPATIHHALPELLALLADMADNMARAKLAADQAMAAMGPEFEGAMGALFDDPGKLAAAIETMAGGVDGAADFGALVESGAFGAADAQQANILGQTLADAIAGRQDGTS